MARILVSEKNYIDELATNQERNLKVVCERLFLSFYEESKNYEMATRIAWKLQDEPHLLCEMLQQGAVELLFELWDGSEEEMDMDPYLNELQQLRYLGFVSLEEELLSVNLEAKDIFYFSLKSRKTKEAMIRYTEWEQVIFGMLFYYGILDVHTCHGIFCRAMDEEIPYKTLEQFLMIRIVFWRSGLLLRNQQDMHLFMASREVMNRNVVFDQWNEWKDLQFKEYRLEEYKNLAMGNGIIGWDGIPELFQFILEEVEDDRYQAMLLVKSIVLMIQNGESYLEVVLQFAKMLPEEDADYEKTASQYLKRIFYSVPIYGQKGYSREELARQKEGVFHVIDGGKH